MNITIVEPFLTGSHASWAEGYSRSSRHTIQVLGLPGRHWKWRMHGGAVTLAQIFMSTPFQPDLILASDMLDLTTFLALTRDRTAGIPTAVYFHENQLTYPWSPDDSDPKERKDVHYAFINYASALAADAVLFNSEYHQSSFFKALPGFLAGFPDFNERDTIAQIKEKSRTLYLGLDLQRFDGLRPSSNDRTEPPLILWNHRWEFDKNPDEFFDALITLHEEGISFRLAVVGESYTRKPPVFERARKVLKKQVVQWGYVESFADYARGLWQADLLPVTSIHDFFGISVVEAMYCGCRPLLPDRLAYPEHIPAGLQDRFLYRKGEFVTKLRGILQGERLSEPSEELVATVSRYDWSRMAPLYDALLEDIAARGKTACRTPPQR